MNYKKEIMREIGATARCFESIANIEFKDYELSKNQYIYLVRICEQPGIILDSVCDMVKVDKSTASRAVKKLCKDYFVYKQKSETNGKKLNLYPTEKGLKVYEMLKNDEDYSYSVSLKDFNKEELETLHGYLVRIRNNITPDWETVKAGGIREYKKVKLEEIESI